VIIYDLKCKKDHKFEGWFKDRSAFEEQNGRGLVVCPVCGEAGADVVPSSVAVMGREMKLSKKNQSRELSPMRAIQQFNEYLEKKFDDVGQKFAEVALRIHRGEEEARNIKGTTTNQEEETLREEGVQFFKVPIVKLDS
jgi:hypothetical protein